MCSNHSNRGVVYKGPGEVAVESIAFPELSVFLPNWLYGPAL